MQRQNSRSRKKQSPPKKRGSRTVQQENSSKRPLTLEEREHRRKMMTGKKSKRRKRNVLPVVVLLMLAIYLVYSYINQSFRLSKLRQEKEHLEMQKVVLQKEIETLKLDYANKDSLDFVEKIAREKLGMIKSNEQIYIDINHSPNKPEGTTP